jgi:hypothetical protein
MSGSKGPYEKTDPDRTFLPTFSDGLNLDFEVDSKLFDPILISYDPAESSIPVFLEAYADFVSRLVKRQFRLIEESERLEKILHIYMNTIEFILYQKGNQTIFL